MFLNAVKTHKKSSILYHLSFY